MKQPHLQTLNWIRFQGLPRDKEGLQHLHLQRNCQITEDLSVVSEHGCFMFLSHLFHRYLGVQRDKSSPIPSPPETQRIKANSTSGSLQQQTSLVSSLIICKGHMRHLAHEQIHQPSSQKQTKNTTCKT